MKLNKIVLLFLLFILSGYELSAQCGTGYVSSDDTIVCVPKIVRFKVHRFPAGTTFEWDLGSGYVSSDSTYTKLYATSGVFNVRVKLKYLDGSNCVIDMVNFIQAKPVPIPQYSVSKTVICNYKDSVILTDLSPKTVSRDWLVDNTLYSNGPKSLKAIFHAPSGWKDFTIFMRDSFGCEGKKTFDSTVLLPDSIAVDFMADQLKGCTPKLLNFENQTDTLGYPIASWNWSFPGGASPASSNVYEPKNVLYNLRDTFDVKLTVTTKRGCQYEKTRNDFLMFADSTALNTTFSKNVLCGNEHLTVTLNNGRSGLPLISVVPNNITRTVVTPYKHSFKFTNFGVYTIYISDELNGCKSERNYVNQITVNGPIGGFTIPNSYSCLRPDTFSAFDTSRMNIGVAKSVRWDLYNDSFLNTSLQTVTTNPAKLICPNYASYAVRLIVTGANGCKDTVLKRNALYIKRILPVFSWKPKPACPIEMMEFENATMRGTSKAENRYRWTFYNLPSGIIKTDTVVNPKISYPDTGHYSVKLVVFNNLGCKDSLTELRTIVIERPIPKFNISDSNVCFRKYVGLSAKYKDSNYYKTYKHQWIFQHTDSAKVKYAFNGDSVNVSLLPGMYTIKYTRYSVRLTCYDTILLPFRLKVSGVNFLPTINPMKVCNPFNATLFANQTYTYNFKNNSTTPITHIWQSYYDTNKVVIRKPTLNPTGVFIKKSGYFYFNFKYTHASGCNDSVNTTTMTSGVVAAYIPNGNSYYACVGKPLNLFNRSDKDAIKFKWFMRDSGSGATFLPTDTSKNAKVLFKNEGIYRVGLIAYGDGNCTDTTIAAIYSNNIKAIFNSDDTLNYCAPIIARITAVRHPAIYEYRWYLGDGDSVTNNLSTFGHLYSQNTGPDGSDVKLVVKGYGCNDTADKKGYIKVIGPIPKFFLTNNVGCEKLKVNFNNQSKYYRRFFLEYGDGSTLDSINFNTHTYQIFDRALPFQKFKPTLSVIDSFGCIVQYTKDTVFVLKSPEPKFTVLNDTGCADLLVQFRNNSIGGVSYKWDFDGNGTIESNSFAPRYNYPPGDYNPVLIAKAANGCEDTARNLAFIKAYKRPDVTFTASTDSVCYNGRIQFNANSLPSNSDIKNWEWDFGDPAVVNDTAYTQNAGYNFRKIGLSQILLLVKDKNNCTDTADKFIYTNDTIGPVSEPMNYVTVANNQFIDVNWSQSKYKYFTGYRLFNDNAPNYTLLYSTANRKDTTFRVNSGIDVSTSRYCYVIKTRDKCSNLGAVTFPHCTIFLQVTDTAINDLILDWLPYEGWGAGNVRRYRIYRSEAGGPFKLLDSTVSGQTTYRDRKLCNKLYCYYIEAVERSGRWTSKSNTVCKTSLYVAPSVPVNSIRTTVLPGNKTYTQWRRYTYIKNVDHYVITRSYTGSAMNSHYDESDSLGYIDDDQFMENNRVSYTYTVKAVDHCGAESPESPVNTTILLKGKSEGYIAKLNWTKYDKWYSGVKQYQVLLRENQTFKVIGSIDTASSLYQFDFLDTKLDDSICFKIQAIKDTSEFVESFSNLLCLISEAKIFVPNAFTPNGDTKNEVFIPRAILIFNQTGNPILDYKFEVYNRWGEQVFFSNDVNIGWDGTYKGEPCQEGHYLYKVRALALDGVTSFNLEGIFVLLR